MHGYSMYQYAKSRPSWENFENSGIQLCAGRLQATAAVPPWSLFFESRVGSPGHIFFFSFSLETDTGMTLETRRMDMIDHAHAGTAGLCLLPAAFRPDLAIKCSSCAIVSV
ncbi:hypothetical protein ABW21_db0205929 [Orbilia brochopaga]|nr:hypothetical protein ABW21_db0205929 [Drechslerella brochopaga]